MNEVDKLEIRCALAGSPRAEQLIACLEGEIAKRDEELAACKAQEPVEYQQLSRYENWDRVDKAVFELGLLSSAPERFRALYAAPVSEAKAQGVVMPERDAVIRKAVGMCNRIPGSTTWNAAEFAYDELAARLNAAPVQQVSVPVWMASARAFADRLYMAGWRDHADAQHSGVAGMYDELLNAVSAAPAADASGVLEQAMYTLISIGYHENSGLVHELRQALAAHRAKGVV